MKRLVECRLLNVTFIVLLAMYGLVANTISDVNRPDKKSENQPRPLSRLPGPQLFPNKDIFTNSLTFTLSKICPNTCCQKADIYVTLDGSDPKTSATKKKYTAPITIEESTTIKAVLLSSDSCQMPSTVIEKQYTHISPLPIPEVTPEAGFIHSGEKISLKVKGFEGDTSILIFYSIDGRDPSTAGKKYTKPFTLTQSTTLRAIAVNPSGSYLNSPIFYRYFEYRYSQVPRPKALPPSNNFTRSINVALSVPGFDKQKKLNIYYTLDGTEPTESSLPYLKPIGIAKSCTLTAVAMMPGYRKSTLCKEFYARGTVPVAPKPSVSHQGKVYSGGIPKITLASTLDKAMVLYTLDNTEPTMASTLWDSRPLYLEAPATLKVKVFKEDWLPSVTITEHYDYETLASPVTNHPSGTVFSDSLIISLSMPHQSITTGVRLYYTLDGSDPDKHGRLFSAPFTIYNSCFLKVFARKKNYYDSDIMYYEYFNLIKVTQAYLLDRDQDGFIEKAVIHFNRPLEMLPSLIEFTYPYSGERILVEADRMGTITLQEAKQFVEVTFDPPLISQGAFPSGYYGRIPLPGEFDTAPFLVDDSTGAKKKFVAARDDITIFGFNNLSFNDEGFALVHNPFTPGKSTIPDYIVHLDDNKNRTGTAIVARPRRPSVGTVFIFDTTGTRMILTRQMVEVPVTGVLFLTWDGKDTQGKIVDKGKYVVKVHLSEKQSGEKSATRVIVNVE